MNIEKIEKRWNLGKPYVIISKIPDNDVIEAVGDIDDLITGYRQLERALGQVVNMLGPEIPDCERHIYDGQAHCEGLLAEAHEALRIAQEALTQK